MTCTYLLNKGPTRTSHDIQSWLQNSNQCDLLWSRNDTWSMIYFDQWIPLWYQKWWDGLQVYIELWNITKPEEINSTTKSTIHLFVWSPLASCPLPFPPSCVGEAPLDPLSERANIASKQQALNALAQMIVGSPAVPSRLPQNTLNIKTRERNKLLLYIYVYIHICTNK